MTKPIFPVAETAKNLPEQDTNWKFIAEKLWDLLDDISTLGDVYKPEHTPYFHAVNKVCEKRGEYLESDGYNLKPRVR
jgi:hypothetical protein